MVRDLEAQLDYERIRREKLEAQLDDYRRHVAYLETKAEQAKQSDDVSLVNIKTADAMIKPLVDVVIKSFADIVLMSVDIVAMS